MRRTVGHDVRPAAGRAGPYPSAPTRLLLSVLLAALAACQPASSAEQPAAGTAAAVSGGATADTTGGAGGAGAADDTRTQVAFAYADRNADGTVSLEEFRNRMMRAFHHSDVDASGHLDTTEYHGLAGPQGERNPLDTTHVTPEAVNAELTALFERTDADRNGYLSLAEWRALPTRQRQ